MTEAGSQEEPVPSHDAEGREPVRRIPDIISMVKDSYSELRPAERRVADVVLDDVKYAVDASNAALAQRAGVSEPTVTRFCRAIGCEGVRDFKLKLAQSLVVGALYLSKPLPTSGDNGMPFWNAVFGEARRALQEAERQLDPAQLQKAAELIAKARQVTVFGLGGSSSALAQETQYRLFRYGITISAQCDPYLMRMTASTLKPGDLVIAISATGRTREVIEAVELAKHYRANAIAVTAPDTELARACDIRLTGGSARISRHAEADGLAIRLPGGDRPAGGGVRLQARPARPCAASSTTPRSTAPARRWSRSGIEAGPFPSPLVGEGKTGPCNMAERGQKCSTWHHRNRQPHGSDLLPRRSKRAMGQRQATCSSTTATGAIS